MEEHNGRAYVYRCEAKENLMTFQQRLRVCVPRRFCFDL